MKLSPAEKIVIKELFNNNGSVLDFSDVKFNNFTEECIGVRLKEYYNCSKGKALEKYIDEADISKLIFLIEELLKYAVSHNAFFEVEHANSVNICKQVIKRYKASLEHYSDSQLKQEPLIFISHSSKDKKYGNALRNLLTGLGVKNNQLIYTSHPLHGIPTGENIFEYLRKNIHSNVFMIFLLSDEYFKSVPCLNEMGAAWVSKSDYLSVFVPNFNFKNPRFIDCIIDKQKMGIDLSDLQCKTRMLNFKNQIKSLFNLSNNEASENYLLDEFMKEIKIVEGK